MVLHQFIEFKQIKVDPMEAICNEGWLHHDETKKRLLTSDIFDP